MDFFAAQDDSRRRTRRLILLYGLAVVAVVLAVTAVLGFTLYLLTSQTNGLPPVNLWAAAQADVLGVIALLTFGLIVVAALFRLMNLAGGGARVARELGGTEISPDTQDLLRRRLRNIVEEMAIASGVPVPQVFVLEREAGINAFAAGYRPEDAAVAVTRGALEQLSRDELQGVIAHEFSHVLNGDMRLNIRLLGPLFGIMVIGYLGQLLIRSNAHRHRMVRSRGAAFAFVLGLGLTAVGFVGVWAARMIRAGVSRQREFLADASAVQFTRQADGIAGALKRIAAGSNGSILRNADGEEVSHMLIAPGAKFMSLIASHPPIVERIRRLEPGFDARELESLAPVAAPTTGPVGEETGMVAALTSGGALPAADSRFELAPDTVIAHAGDPRSEEISLARELHRSIPPLLYEALHADTEAPLVVLALMLHPDAEPRSAQLMMLGRQLGAERARRVEEYAGQIADLGPQYRLPLLDLAFPALRNRPDAELEYFRELMRRLVDADGMVQLFEYCLSRVIDAALLRAAVPSTRPRTSRKAVTDPELRSAVITVFASLAGHGHDRSAAAVHAFVAGLESLGEGIAPLPEEARALVRPTDGWQRRLDYALERLRPLAAGERRRLVEALTVTATTDGTISVAESELLRVYCAVLDVPVALLYAAGDPVNLKRDGASQ